MRRSDQETFADQARGAEAPRGAGPVAHCLADVELPDLFGVFEVCGSAVEGLIARTDLQNEDALARMQKSLERMGVVDRLRRLGAEEGDKVIIGEHEFDFSDE